MGKTYQRCSKKSFCKKDLSDKPKNGQSSCTLYANNICCNNKHQICSTQNTDFIQTFSKLICCEPKPQCSEKITELTLLLANSLITGNKISDYLEYKKSIEKGYKNWPTNGKLSIISGQEAIEEYIKSINYNSTLRYSVNFITQKVDNLSSSYLFEVKWSQPDGQNPVQIATASMYFSLTKFQSLESEYPIDVSYLYEYSHIILHPGDIKFQNGWLQDVIQHKLHFFQEIGTKMDDMVN